MWLKNRKTLIALAATLVLWGVTIYIYTTLIYAPMHDDIIKTEESIKDLQQRLSVARARSQQLAKIQKEMADLQIEVAEFEKQLPKSRDLPPLLRVFTHRVETFGLSVTSFGPARIVPKSTYDEIQYPVTVSTSFHALGRFLTAMGKGDRLFAARGLSLTSTSSKTDPSKTVNALFTLIAYKYHG